MNNYKTITLLLLLKITSLLLIKITSLLLLKLRHLRVLRDNTRVDLGLRDPFRVCGTIHAWAYLLGAPRGPLSGSPRGVHALRFVLHFHAWHVDMARRVDAAWKWRVEMARGNGAPRGCRVEMARRVDAAWKWDQSDKI